MNDSAQTPNNMHLPQPVVSDANAGQAQPASVSPLMPQASPAPVSMPVAPVNTQAASSAPAAVAQDQDIIEPEWVQSVERTMRQHIDDPRRLAEEFAALKAEYLQKRYGKEIKRAPGGQA